MSSCERLVAVDDAGRIINPLLAEGQRHGGIGSGIGQALYEEFVYDEDGNPLTGNFARLRVPERGRAAVVRARRDGDADADERARREGHRRVRDDRRDARGAQRGRRRARALGVRHVDMPANGESVWRAIQAARGS